MKLYRLMVSILCMALLMVLWGCFPCVAEILVRDGHVTGGKDIDRKSFTYDFALPAEIKHVKQYKTELISMNLSHVASVLEGFTQKPRSGDSWGFMNSSQWPCTNFCYFEQNGKYACEGSYYYGPSKRMEGKRYEEAINTVSALLKALHVTEFESPFYVYTSQCRSAETIFEPITSEADYIRVKDIPESVVQEYYEKEALGIDRTMVVVRFLIDGIPLCISDTSPHAKEGDLDEVTGAAGIFMLNENEEIIRAQIRNYVQVVDAREDTREILPWQDCIDTIAQGTNLGERVTITEVELNLSLGKNGMTYPVWRFAGYSDLTFLRTLNPEVVINSSDFSCCVDAYTGQCLYY